jgi:hypothetical protein
MPPRVLMEGLHQTRPRFVERRIICELDLLPALGRISDGNQSRLGARKPIS